MISTIREKLATIPVVRFSDGEEAIKAIASKNIYSSEAERSLDFRMGSIARIMYSDYTNLESIQDLFPNGLKVLKTPEELGISVPAGLRVQAFRNGKNVIIGMRGTELTHDWMTKIKNIIADLGIGRHKTDDDLIGSVDRIKDKVKELYKYEVDPVLYDYCKKVVQERVKGDTDAERIENLIKDELWSGWDGIKKAGIGGIWTTAIGGTALTGFGLMTLPITIGVAVVGTISVGLLAAGIKMTETAIEEIPTMADGYPELLSYFKAIDDYYLRLKENEIKSDDFIMTTGHSLGGFLSGVIGYFHADKAFSFNGPGVKEDNEVKKIMNDLGVLRTKREGFEYRSLLMEGDFVGNLGERDGVLRTLHLPLTIAEAYKDLPKCLYDSPLAHHGMDIIQAVIEYASVEGI